MEAGTEASFSVLDYCLFFITLLINPIIGIYFGFVKKKQDNPDEYLYGGRKMTVLPIAFSLIASDISGLTFLGIPADIYMHGSALWVSSISTAFAYAFIAHVVLPVFYRLQVGTCYEYLKFRYGNTVCILASVTFALTVMLYIPIILYIPALALSQVSGLSLNVIIPIVCIVTIFYTTIGGLQAVVWTDTVQLIIIFVSIIIVFILGIIVEGGFENIWRKSDEGQRIDFNLSFDPTDRTATFTIFFGTLFLLLSYGINPVFCQRFLSVPSLRVAQKTSYLLILGLLFVKTFSVGFGLILFAYFKDCDPVRSGKIEKPDQLVPFYIMNVAKNLPGLSGVFMAGIFSAALSTLSSALNTMAGTIYKDLLASRLSPGTTDKTANNIMKGIVVAIGILCMVMVYAVPHLGGVYQLSMVIGGLSSGPLLAVFLLGMTTTFVNMKGIIYGATVGILVVSWMLFGAQYYTITGKISTHTLPTSVEMCGLNITDTNPSTHTTEENVPFIMYRISFMYYTFIGFILTTAVAIPVSLLQGGRKQIINRDLLTPVLYRNTDVNCHVRELEILNRT